MQVAEIIISNVFYAYHDRFSPFLNYVTAPDEIADGSSDAMSYFVNRFVDTTFRFTKVSNRRTFS